VTSVAIVKAPIAGGTRTKVANAGPNPRNAGVNAAGVYWLNQSSNMGGTTNAPNGTILSAPLAGGTVTTLASAQTPLWIAVDANNVYWPNGGSQVAGNLQPAGIMKVAVAGGTPRMIAPATLPEVVAIDATNIYWVDGRPATKSGAIIKAPLAGGTATCIATGPLLSFGIAVDDTSVYWTDNSRGTVMKAPK